MTRLFFLALPAAFAALTLVPSAQAGASKPKGHALDQRPAVFVPAPFGADARLSDENGKTVGTIADHVLRAGSGEVLALVLKADGRDLLVPWKRVQLDDATGELILSTKGGPLSDLPEFRREELELVGGGNGAVPAAADGQAPRRRNLLASEVQGADLLVDDEPAGKVGTLILDRPHGTIAFVMLAGPAREPATVVAFPALHHEAEKGFRLSIGASEWQGAPRATLEDLAHPEPGVVEAICRFYHVPPPPPAVD